MIDVSVGIEFFGANYQHKTFNGSAYNDIGEATDSYSAATSIKASIQPVSGSDRKDVPEGIRDEVSWIAYAKAAIKNNDLIYKDGQEYVVLHTWPWSVGNYTKAALGLKR